MVAEKDKRQKKINNGLAVMQSCSLAVLQF